MRILFFIFILPVASLLPTEQTKPLKQHLLEFYRGYDLKADHLTFDGSCRLLTMIYFKLSPKTYAYAVKNGTRIELSPKLKKSLEAAIKAHRPFDIFDQLTLLHEYAHTEQTKVNTLLENDLIRQQVLEKLDFEVLPPYQDEFCPDLFALGKMAAYAPDDIITFCEQRSTMVDYLNKFLENSNNSSLSSRWFKVMYTDDGEHLNESNKLQLLKVMSKVARATLQKRAQKTTYGTFDITTELDQILPGLLQFFKQLLS